jgi:hypothetical protein|tara:strand:+ start:161 stop:493 length:333 start_codon:yes stop_codon:yes gene_type:complete
MQVADRESEIAKESEIFKSVTPDSPMKVWLIDYVGEKFQQEMVRFKSDTGKEYEWDGNITVEMIVDLMAKEFPEFVMALAEENFIRGYRQAFADLEAGQEMAQAEQNEQE